MFKNKHNRAPKWRFSLSRPEARYWDFYLKEKKIIQMNLMCSRGWKLLGSKACLLLRSTYSSTNSLKIKRLLSESGEEQRSMKEPWEKHSERVRFNPSWSMRRHVNKSTSWVRPLSVFIFCNLDFFLSVLTPRDYNLNKLERTDDQKPGKRGLWPPPQELAFCLSRALPSEGRSWNEVAGFANYMAPDIWETSSKQWFKVTLGHFIA